ncbi:MAG: hypothetical protein R3F34_14010 [Planctomycetota bacterium]
MSSVVIAPASRAVPDAGWFIARLRRADRETEAGDEHDQAGERRRARRRSERAREEQPDEAHDQGSGQLEQPTQVLVPARQEVRDAERESARTGERGLDRSAAEEGRGRRRRQRERHEGEDGSVGRRVLDDRVHLVDPGTRREFARRHAVEQPVEPREFREVEVVPVDALQPDELDLPRQFEGVEDRGRGAEVAALDPEVDRDDPEHLLEAVRRCTVAVQGLPQGLEEDDRFRFARRDRCVGHLGSDLGRGSRATDTLPPARKRPA